MAVIYGVLRGKLDRWKREDSLPGSNKSPHLRIRVLDGHGKPWRIPVNVRSGDVTKSLVIFHRAEPLLSHPILGGLPLLATGLTDLHHKPRSATNALDYSRAPLFDWPTGTALPPTGPGADDDLQDVVSRQLQNLKVTGGELFAFGSHFHDPAPKPGIDAEFGTTDGMHDIHMNQGNAPHEHDEDNGVFNDGGLILHFPDHFVGLFLRFKSPVVADGSRTATAFRGFRRRFCPQRLQRIGRCPSGISRRVYRAGTGQPGRGGSGQRSRGDRQHDVDSSGPHRVEHC